MGQKLAARGGKRTRKTAVVAVARKLGAFLHRLWVTGEVYEPSRNVNRIPCVRKQQRSQIWFDFGQRPSGFFEFAIRHLTIYPLHFLHHSRRVPMLHGVALYTSPPLADSVALQALCGPGEPLSCALMKALILVSSIVS
jgi:hypothetical protein